MSAWIGKLKQNPIDWLLDSNPWTRYKTYTDLLDLDKSSPEAVSAKAELTSHEQVISLAAETKDWLSIAAGRNSDPKISYFKLKVLAEFGLEHKDLGLQDTVAMASEHMIEDMFGVRGQLPELPKKGEKYEKPDLSADVWHIAPCNTPVITSAMLELGVKNQKVEGSVNELKAKWTSREGWFCHLFFVESQFRKLQIGCPVAGLQSLEVFSKRPELKESKHSRFAFEPIKFHKEYGQSLYYFGRSRKFWTFKYPFVWYNALYLADVLTRFEFTRNESLVRELIEWIVSAQDESGRYKPTSMFMNYKGWDFSNKKEPSPWITFLCCRILKQYYG
jgi:hypothetical protein